MKASVFKKKQDKNKEGPRGQEIFCNLLEGEQKMSRSIRKEREKKRTKKLEGKERNERS